VCVICVRTRVFDLRALAQTNSYEVKLRFILLPFSCFDL